MSQTHDKSDVVGRGSPRGGSPSQPSAASDVGNPPNAASGDAAYNSTRPPDVGRVPPHGVPNPNEPPPRRLRRLHRVWPDRDGNISYLLTICVDGRTRVLDNHDTFQRLVAFLLDNPQRYHWFGRRFVVMPDHIHLIAHMGHDAVRLGQWIKALKVVVGGLKPREERPVGALGLQDPAPVGRVPSHGEHEFTRIKRSWRWQDGFHDHKFRTPESEARKWEYVCLNPVRYHLVQRPEEWPYGGEIFYDDAAGPRLVPGTPPLLETGILIEKDGTPRENRSEPPREATRPTA